jgi:hypothetical protein
MRPEELTALLRQRSFVPFRIHMTDGHSYEIHHPEAIVVSRSFAFIGLRPDPETGVVDRSELCALLHIVRVEILWPVTSSRVSFHGVGKCPDQ